MIRRIKIIEDQNREFDGIIKLCRRKGYKHNCYFILTNNYFFDGEEAETEENYEFSWCIETESDAKRKNLDLKKLKKFDDYDWAYNLPIGHNYKIIFIDNSSFEDIEL